MADRSQYKSAPQVVVRESDSGYTVIDTVSVSSIHFQVYMKSSTGISLTFWGYNGLTLSPGGEKRYANITKSIYDGTNFKYDNSSFDSPANETTDISLHLEECPFDEIKIVYDWVGTAEPGDSLIISARK